MEKDVTNAQLSIIIPLYNAEKYIEKCVDSLLDIKLDAMEIIIVDDGSTDSSYNKCLDLSKSDKRIKLFSKKNGGSASARNYGLQKASGEYISFIDSDDYIDSSGYTDVFIKTYEQKADIGCFGIVSEDIGCILIPERSNQSIWSLFIKYPVYMHSVCNKFFARKTLENIQFDTDLVVCEDMLFCAKAFLKSSNNIFFDKCIYTYRKKNDSITHATQSEKKAHDDIVAADRLLNYYKDHCRENNNETDDIEKLVTFRHQIAGLRYLTEPDVFSINKYHTCIRNKDGYKYLADSKHRALCWFANQRVNLIPYIYCFLHKLRQRMRNNAGQ